MNANFQIPFGGYGELRYAPQMPGLANTNPGMNPIYAPNPINQNNNLGVGSPTYQITSQRQFGNIDYNHIMLSNTIQGLGSYLRGINQKNDFNNYNKIQSNPLLQIPNNPNTSQQSQYGMNQFKKGGLKKKLEGGENPLTLQNAAKAKQSGWRDTQLLDDVNILLSGQNKFPRGYEGDEQKLLMSAYIWNQQNKGKAPLESINSFFNKPVDSNNSVDILRQKLNKIGYGADSMYNSTPNITLNKKAEGGFSDFDDFNEEDFQDLKDQMDRYFSEKGKVPDIEDKDEVEDTKQEVDEPDQPMNHSALNYLNEPEEQDNNEPPTQYVTAPPINLGASSMPDQSGNPLLQSFKRGIANVENANYGEGNKYSSAFGKYQFTAPTLEAVREQHFSNINKKDFTNTYKQDPQFQERVMDAYGTYLLGKFGDPHKAALAFYLGPGKANYVNQPEYNPGHGNISVGKYLSMFDKGYGKRMGGHIMNKPEQIDLNFKEGGTYNLTKLQIENLRKQGYEIEEI